MIIHKKPYSVNIIDENGNKTVYIVDAESERAALLHARYSLISDGKDPENYTITAEKAQSMF